jgi:hypothetical protein
MNDSWITEQVRLRLVADNDIKGTNFNIQVHNGVVYLLGTARSEEELRKAAEHASLVNGVQKVVSYVKMRERGSPPPDISVAAAPPSDQLGQPVPVDDTQGAIRIAPPAAAPAPITGPVSQPTTRGQYTDPYAPGAAPPPGATNNSINLLQSSPLPPPRGDSERASVIGIRLRCRVQGDLRKGLPAGAVPCPFASPSRWTRSSPSTRLATPAS